LSGALLSLNAGSSSLKFALFETSAGLPEIARGEIEKLGHAPRLKCKVLNRDIGHDWPGGDGPKTPVEAFAAIWEIVGQARKGQGVDFIAHRIVHGGRTHDRAARVDARLIVEMERFIHLAPLHQPAALGVLAAATAAAPAATQAAFFDTAFHRGRAFRTEAFALPLSYYDEGVLKYGFHGISYASILSQMRWVAPDLARGRLVVAHLGSGCSLAAIADGRSVATTMGFSALDGLPMGTRCGRLDAGVVLYLMREHGMGVETIEDLLYRRSGLLGLSGVSGDMRDLLASVDPHAQAAVDYFVSRTAVAVAEMAAELGGLHALVFTGGMGEASPEIRARIVERCAWLGLKIAPQANADGAAVVSAADSPVRVLAIATDEEREMATETSRLLGLFGG
jgi:acetate kinase